MCHYIIIQNDINSSAAVYTYMMACFFMTLSFMFLNWLFALFSLWAKWHVLSLLERVKYIAIVLLFNGLAGYLTVKLWDKDGGNVISLNNKSKLDGFSVLCYVLLSISVLLPLFIAQRKFK